MRAAEAQDWVRRLMRKVGNYPTALRRLSVTDVSEVGEIELSLSQPLTTICGPNGVGKSILLKSIEAALNADSVIFSKNSGIPKGIIELSGTVGDDEFSVRRHQATYELHGKTPQTTFADCGSFAIRLSEIWSEIEDTTEILNEVEPLELEGEHLEDVRYVACRNYRYVRVYEVDVGEPAPYFEVGYGDAQYDSRNMGLGELNALASWWSLRRSEPGTLLLIEEPEAFLSSLAQEHLSHVLAKYVVKKRLTAIISTHSEAFIRITDRSSLIFLTREAGGQLRANPRPHSTMLKTVGIQFRLAAIVYVEDVSAECLAKAIVRESDPELLPTLEFHSMGGDGEVTTAIRSNRILRSRVKFLAAFDGDLRDRIPEDIADVSVTLPGSVPFEDTLRLLVETNYADACAALAHNDAHQILASIDGLNHHDWLTNLAAGLDTDVPTVISRLLPLWLSIPDNRSEAELFCQKLRGHLR